MSDPLSQIGMHKSIQWEIAKGHLLAAVAAGGSGRSEEGDNRWVDFKLAVDEFILSVEGEEWHL